MTIRFKKCAKRSSKKKAQRSAGLFESFFVILNLWVNEKEVVDLQPLFRTDGALVASKDVLGIDVADHRVNEGIGDVVPCERGNIGIARGGSGDGRDAQLRTHILHSLADLAVEVVGTAFNLGLGGGIEENLREDATAFLRLSAVLGQQLLQRLGDGDVDGDLDLIGNLAADIGQLVTIEIVIVPDQLGDVLHVGAVAEIEDEPPVSGLAVAAFVVANLHDVGHGDEILLATGGRLDGELGRFGDDLLCAQAIEDGTEGTEIDALGRV